MKDAAARHPIVIDSAGGEYMESVVVTSWAVEPGARVTAGETVVTVETAKAATEVHSPHDGYLAEILHAAGSEAQVGAVLGYISDRPVTMTRTVPATGEQRQAPPAAPAPVRLDVRRITASPYARRLAEERQIDLRGLKGSGPSGRIKARDLPRLSATAAAAQKYPVIFLHGFGADQSIWRWVRPLLRIANPVITLDLPGHGASAAGLPGSIAGMAETISAEISRMGVSDAHLIGHSLGGAVALALGVASPLRIHSLGLIAPAGLGADIDTAFLRGLIASQTPDALQPWLDQMVANPASLPANFGRAVLWQRKSQAREAEQMELAEKLFTPRRQRESFATNLRQLRIPIKIIWGRADAIIPMSHALEAPGSAGLHLLENTGHVPQLECPHTLARLIDELVMSTGC